MGNLRDKYTDEEWDAIGERILLEKENLLLEKEQRRLTSTKKDYIKLLKHYLKSGTNAEKSSRDIFEKIITVNRELEQNNLRIIRSSSTNDI